MFLQTLDGASGTGFTLDLSSRGALLWMLFAQSVATQQEITLGEDMSVRCRAHVLRLEPDNGRGNPATAVQIEHYDFVPRELTPLQQHLSGGVHVTRA